MIHIVSSGNDAVHFKWPLEVFNLGDFDGVYLKGLGKDGFFWDAARRAVCEEHWAQHRCIVNHG